MNKGLLALFAAVSLCGVSSSFASAPIISNLPDITISEQEDNIGGSDNNFFVYTNAFKFENYVNDDATSESNLLWSFDEGNDPTNAGNLTPWFNVNGKAPIHVGTTAMGTDSTTNFSAHASPANELRQPNNLYASFRDVTFTPGTRTLPPGFNDPTADHSMGKFVQFFVSDGTTVTASNTILVKSINNVQLIGDSISGGSQFRPVRYGDMYRDKFIQFSGNVTGYNNSTNTSGWYYSGDSIPTAQGGLPQSLGPGMDYNWDSVNQALRIHVYSASISGGYSVRTRNGGFYAIASDGAHPNGADVPYATVGANNVVRGKFWVFATGQQNASAKNQIPPFAFRIGSGFAVQANLEVTGHSNDLAIINRANPTGPAINEDARMNEMNPSKNPSLPSMFRVDYLPMNVTGVANLPITRSFQVTAIDPQDNGDMELAEAVVGTYPASLISDANGTVMKTWAPSDLTKAKSDVSAYDVQIGPAVDGSLVTPRQTTGTDIPVVLDVSGGGMSIDTTPVPNYTMSGTWVDSRMKVGIVEDYFSAKDVTTGYNASVPRVSAGEQYKIRFHLTSTFASNRQSVIWFYTRTVDYAYIQKLELEGSRLDAGGANDQYAAKVYPGTGSAWTSGDYDVLVYTPLSKDIRPEFATVAQGMPYLSGDWGNGATTLGSRDFNIGIVTLDTLNFTNPDASNEATNLSVTGASCRKYTAVLD